MEYLSPFLNNAGAVVLIIILWKSGVLKALLEMKNGNGNGKQEYINTKQDETNKKVDVKVEDLEKHAIVANQEMGVIKDSVIRIETSMEKTHKFLEEHAKSDTEVQAKILATLDVLKK